MTSVHHLNCVKIESPLGSAIGHCLLLNENDKLVLVDAGIGLSESREPEKYLGKELIEVTGFDFDEALTALNQIKGLGLDPFNVKHIICSHLDPDHIGGLADFPWATVHVSHEEYTTFTSGHERYLPQQLAHQPELRLYESNDVSWFGLPARKLALELETEIYLIPLFGHTLGHCGIALKVNDKWIFYAGDAYYLRAELLDKNHPVDQLATMRAVDNTMRLKSLETVRQLLEKYGAEMEYFGYHDPTEFLE
ncbi:MAG: MBL fold metallo-hydrolase [Bacteroidota bacterium]